jgi:hypothetical protein
MRRRAGSVYGATSAGQRVAWRRKPVPGICAVMERGLEGPLCDIALGARAGSNCGQSFTPGTKVLSLFHPERDGID